MQKAIGIFSVLFLLSYLVALGYQWFALGSWYSGELHLQLVLLSLGLWYFVRFVQSGSVLAVIFASILLPQVKMYFLWQQGQVLQADMMPVYYLLFLLSYSLVIYQIAKLKKQLRQQQSQQQTKHGDNQNGPESGQ
ncbi:hypothetical protein [Rheinheimera sp. 4Y26]|uniref:hypothetical protein n=1 Tax=Rheinheimera sp. 4Y26 TaxID=2977811 RepID=UPI0021B0D012|nr:hypothetical protein [Rheinheimera sp. 4Y26]MCT6698081.1 hypothetical protein [Rheinheimera sp. 4Y26]